MKVKHIDSFLFDQAHYTISNSQGEKVTLKIDYKNNKFTVGALQDKQSQKEITQIAKDLLKRKHNVNFAEK